MKKLNITKEQFNRSNYFQKKYGKLEYVSESGKLFKTNKGKVLKFNEGFMSNIGKDGQRLYSIVYSSDGWDGSVQEYGKSKEDAIQTAIAKGKLDGDEDIAENADEYTTKKLGYSESKKLVKEGAGAGYTVTIKDLKLGSILEKKYVKMKKDYESYWECQVEVMPGEYEIEASDYYNDFFWQEHEFGDTPTAKIDGGIATISYSTNSYDEDEAEDELRREVARRTMDVSFDYGWGWTHADLPREKIEADHVDASGEFYGSIDKLELNAPDLADAVNSGYQSTFDQGEDAEEDEDGEPVNEVSGWKLEDEDLTLVNTESDGDKLYIVKLWWGSGY